MVNINDLSPLQKVLQELETTLAKYEASLFHEGQRDRFLRGYYDGYTDGLKRAIQDINYEIGIRQDPPNINYPGERPQ